MGNADGYLKARELLLELRTDYAAARDRFEWPRPEEFNWALDFFDVTPKGERDALILLEDNGSSTRCDVRRDARAIEPGREHVARPRHQAR